MGVATVAERKISLEAEHLEDIRLAASKMTGARRRAFQAEMALKYCSGSARRAEEVFGWSRQAVRKRSADPPIKEPIGGATSRFSTGGRDDQRRGTGSTLAKTC
jgi:hypothetical protein